MKDDIFARKKDQVDAIIGVLGWTKIQVFAEEVNSNHKPYISRFILLIRLKDYKA